MAVGCCSACFRFCKFLKKKIFLKKKKEEEEKWFIGQSEYVDGRLIATFNDWLFFMMNSTTNEDWDAKRTKKVDLLLFLFGPSPEIFTIVRKTKTKERRFVEIFLF